MKVINEWTHITYVFLLLDNLRPTFVVHLFHLQQNSLRYLSLCKCARSERDFYFLFLSAFYLSDCCMSAHSHTARTACCSCRRCSKFIYAWLVNLEKLERHMQPTHRAQHGCLFPHLLFDLYDHLYHNHGYMNSLLQRGNLKCVLCSPSWSHFLFQCGNTECLTATPSVFVSHRFKMIHHAHTSVQPWGWKNGDQDRRLPSHPLTSRTPPTPYWMVFLALKTASFLWQKLLFKMLELINTFCIRTYVFHTIYRWIFQWSGLQTGPCWFGGI